MFIEASDCRSQKELVCGSSGDRVGDKVSNGRGDQRDWISLVERSLRSSSAKAELCNSRWNTGPLAAGNDGTCGKCPRFSCRRVKAYPQADSMAIIK